jgi:asparagine synthase (glutamine-hydrolysing)
MGGLAGCAGVAAPDVVAAMLAAIPHRGERTRLLEFARATLGVRQPGLDPADSAADSAADSGERLGVLVGRTLPTLDALGLLRRLDDGAVSDLDGAFTLAAWDPASDTLTLARDPFGVRSLYYAQRDDTLWFASELKQLLAVPDLPVELDPVAIHKYLTFSFVPGEATPLAGVRRLLPGHVLTFRQGTLETRPWFTLEERLAPVEPGRAARTLWRLGREAVARRLDGGGRVALYLSGGIDSSAVGLWLRDLGADVTAFTLDFGPASVEREEAERVARHVGFPLERVAVDPDELGERLDDLVWKLDLPFGDPVTGPHWLLGRAARAAGLSSVWNGEGGDQLFGGWTSKPMVAAAVYGHSHTSPDEATAEQQYLRSYHKFYGLEQELYAPALAERVSPGERRGIIQRFLGTGGAQAFLNRVRLTDLSLKGSQNILPRAERMAAAHSLELEMPLFDRALAEWSFTLPTPLKLKGACEKFVLKLALQAHLPDDIVWRRKFGMSVPVTDWVQGPLRPHLDDLLSDRSVERRGLLQVPFVRALREGRDLAGETRRRRLGERLWSLMILEAWCRRFLDRRSTR